MLLLGLAGASALILGAGDRVLAGEATGVDIKVIKEAASMIPGFPKVRLREATYQPAGHSKNTMQHPMVCECSPGSFAPSLSAEGPVREDVDYMWGGMSIQEKPSVS